MKKRKKMKPVTAWAALDGSPCDPDPVRTEQLLASGHDMFHLSVFSRRNNAVSRAYQWRYYDPGARVVRVLITEAPKKRRSKKP